jgi:hypothetical protein
VEQATYGKQISYGFPKAQYEDMVVFSEEISMLSVSEMQKTSMWLY